MAKGGKRKVAAGDVATNRAASHRYELSDKLECGIALLGTEVKALRETGATIKDGFVTITEGELWLHNVHIPQYAPASHNNHEPERTRKLLAHRGEIEKYRGKVTERGFTIVPTRIYFSPDGRAKVEVALGRGKDRFDKRHSIKERETKRDLDRALREANR